MSVLLLPMPAQGQAPASVETLVNDRIEGTQVPYAAVCTEGSICAIFWHEVQGEGQATDDRIYGRVLSPYGALAPQREIRAQERAQELMFAATETGFLAMWNRYPSQEEFMTILQPLTAELAPAALERMWFDRPLTYYGTEGVIPLRAGFAVLWDRDFFDQPEPPKCVDCNFEVSLTVLDEAGHTLNSQLVNEQPGVAYEEGGGLSLWPQPLGEDQLVAAYRQAGPGDDEQPTFADIFVRGFSAGGDPLGPPQRANDSHGTQRKWPKIAASATGAFVAVWESFGQDGSHEGIYARHFDADGTPKGSEFRVNNVTLSQQLLPAVAMDAHGNFVISWQTFERDNRWQIKARLFRADGSAVRDEITVNQYAITDQELPSVAFAKNGTFFVAWASSGQAAPESRYDIYARRFSASPGEEVCWVSGPALSCDLGRTGGAAELAQWAAWATAGGGVPLLGDFDGDGREDLCSWSAGLFRCDLDHEGRPLEGQASYGGLAGDTPLLGDVDGDGRADPCIRRKRRLLCDTARNGGPAEHWRLLGAGTETPLLGDIDGDGRDDLCLFERGIWACAPWAGGYVQVRFGAVGATPVLADVDGNGRADTCLFAAGELRCDTAHDGAEAEWTLAITAPPGARPLVANLDGL